MPAATAWKQLAQHTDLTLREPTTSVASAATEARPSALETASASGERLGRAARAMSLGDWDAAGHLLSQDVEEQPERWLALDLRAACRLQQGRPEQALDDAMLCTKLSPDWARGWARLGAAQLCLGHPRAAAAAYRRGLGLDPSSREMQLGLRLAREAAAASGDRRKAMRH